ncbi:branched-chain amino acid aminotransferase [Mycoplasma sp. P36-A1]|uniref:branched-chain amino acid aminotransferase n=1 Tax=Mycoplasma sp. P36-A1 TaxID=3252900 RepID=UPI003C2F3423
MNIQFIENTNKRTRPKQHPKFGEVFTNYMFEAKYDRDQGGWISATVKPFQEFSMSPAALCLHYGQTIFEGMKCYKYNNRRVLFRPDRNIARFNKSAIRMGMPTIDEKLFMNGLTELIKAEQDEFFYPELENCYYIRPFMFANQAILGANESSTYTFLIILSPMQSYYSGEVSLITEKFYSRVAFNGTGEAKNGGNYGASFYPTAKAEEKGYTQVLWLDPREHKYIEEAGTMNVFFVVDNKVVTPKANGSILQGVTRASVLEIAPELGYESEEQVMSIDDLVEKYKDGRVSEAFSAGTAASIQPITSITHNDFKMEFKYDDNSACNKIFNYLDSVRKGTIEDKYGYIVEV